MISFESIKITDPFVSRKNHYNVLEKKVIGILRDDRDLSFIHLMLRISLTMLPLGILLFFTQGWLWWAIAAIYFYLNHVYLRDHLV
jgi:hypothetical protein